MTTLAHAVSAGIVAVTAGRVTAAETSYIAVALAAGAVADLDHVVPVLRNWREYRREGFRGRLHAARSPLHEMPGLVLAGIVGIVVWIFDPRMAVVVFAAYAIHLAEDFVLGRSLPFNPVDRTEVQMFDATFPQKVALDVATITLSALLWAAFLRG